MHPPAGPSARISRRSHAVWLPVIAAALALALGLHGPIPQWASYHAFADARAWLGIPNAANVLSNLPFALIGAWGLWLHSPIWPTSPESSQSSQSSQRPAAWGGGRSRAWACFSVALTCTAFGSALYHWAPDNALLVFDRLPIAWACAALLCAFLSERVDARWGGVPALSAALVAATAAVAWWRISEQRGQGDLRPYLYVQFLPMLLVPAALWLKLPSCSAQAVGNNTWWTVLGLYAAAKAMELADQAVFDVLGFGSGHTLKHLLAAAAALCLLRAVAKSGAQLR